MSNHIDYQINKELGECYLFMGEYEKAGDYYKKAAECSSDQPDPYLGLAAIALAAGSMEEALALYLKANKVARGDKPLTGMGLIKMELGRHEEAFDHLVEAIAINPGNIMAVNALVQLAYFLGRIEEIVPHLEAALTVEDNESVRYALAGCLVSLGKNEEAKKQLEQLLGKNPNHGEAQQLYAQVAA